MMEETDFCPPGCLMSKGNLGWLELTPSHLLAENPIERFQKQAIRLSLLLLKKETFHQTLKRGRNQTNKKNEITYSFLETATSNWELSFSSCF